MPHIQYRDSKADFVLGCVRAVLEFIIIVVLVAVLWRLRVPPYEVLANVQALSSQNAEVIEQGRVQLSAIQERLTFLEDTIIISVDSTGRGRAGYPIGGQLESAENLE